MSVVLIRAGVPILVGGRSPLLIAPLASGGGTSGGGSGQSGGGSTGSGGSGGSSSGGGGTTGTGISSLTDVGVLAVGQSNALYTWQSTIAGQPTDTDTNYAGLAPVTVKGIKFWTGATTAELYEQGGNTLIVGHGLYAGLAGNTLLAPGSWLNNPNGSALYPAEESPPSAFIDPSQWQWGADGQAFLSYLATLTAAQVAGICGLWVYWHENDSGRAYAEKATWKAAYLRFLQLVRQQLGKSAASLPVFDWACISSVGDDQGMCMVREVVYELANDTSNNFWVVLPQVGDAIPRGATYNADGTWSGGDANHHDDADYGLWVRRAALPIARAIYTSAGQPAAIPSGAGSGLGPAIAAVSLAANVLTVTVQHDIGTDLVLQLQALYGAGWVIMDGGSVTLPGTLIRGVAAERIDATHLQVTFGGIPCNPLGACRVFYPYGNNLIGRGDCVTDNASTITRPSGWDAGAALGDPLFDQNMPLQMPMTITDAVASCGLLLGPAAADLGPYGFNPQNYALPEAASYAPGATVTSVLDDGSTLAPPYTSPASFQFGITSNPGVLPSQGSWTPNLTPQSGNIWYGNNVAPANPGTYYVVAEGLDSNKNVVSRLTGPQFTVT
jgi:hypothetical protein